jgi:hypothetical protein
MHHRVVRRATAAAIAALLATTVAVFADTVPADGDSVTAGNQNMVDLGQATIGEVVTRNVDFHLTCGGTSHPAPGSTIQLDQGIVSAADDGTITATSTTIEVPADWTASGEGCPSPTPTVAATAPSVVTLTMPSTAGTDDLFTVMWTRTPSSGLSSSTAMTFKIDVIPNTPPVLTVPADQIVEATSASGATATFTATATDAEDTPDPTPTCAPASGSTFPLGPTTVNCTVTDGGGLTDSGSFEIMVVDTTAPTLVGMPSDVSLTTGDPSGATLTYTPPTASDLVDPSPDVSCVPASGSSIPVGTTKVTCTATDATGNHASASFDATVRFVSPITLSAVWGEPVASTGDTYVANNGRTIPVKVELFANGVEQSTGSAALSVAGCAGGSSVEIDLAWDGGRWTGHLDTTRLGGPGCYLVTAWLDGSAAGSFHLDLRGSTAAATAPNSPKAAQPKKTKP